MADHAVRVLLVGCVVALVAACDPGEYASAPPPATCTRIGAQCQLAEGGLGVCLSAPCPAGATPPCLVCTAQH